MEIIHPLIPASVTIGRELFARLLANVASAPGREVCGLLLGKPDAITEVVATTNVAPDPATAFEIEPSALVAAHRMARAGGPSVIGCYHSHPSGRPTPSQRDRTAAEPGTIWLIVAGAEARLYRRTTTSFDEVPLHVVDDHPVAR